MARRQPVKSVPLSINIQKTEKKSNRGSFHKKSPSQAGANIALRRFSLVNEVALSRAPSTLG